MDRREVLRLLATGGLLQLAPTKLFAVLREAQVLVQNQNSPRTLNAHQYSTTKAMAEMIIPRTDTPGASDVGVPDFMDLLLTECTRKRNEPDFSPVWPMSTLAATQNLAKILW